MDSLLSKQLNDQMDFDISALPKNHSFEGRVSFSQEVADLLVGMNMKKYLHLFKNENVSFAMLQTLTDNDLQNLGVSDENDRQKILKQLFKPGLVRSSEDKDLANYRFEDDIIMAQTVLKHVKLLNQNLADLEAKIRQEKLYDYYVFEEHTAKSLIRLICSRSLTILDKMSKAIYSQSDHSGLVNHLSMKEEIELPQFLLAQLHDRQLSKKKLFCISSAFCFISLFIYWYKNT